MKIHEILNHAMHHLVQYALGDRSENHLGHATWNCMAACQMSITHPELSSEDMLGPGATITSEMGDKLDREASFLKERRRTRGKEFGDWKLEELPDIVKLIKQRQQVSEHPGDSAD